MKKSSVKTKKKDTKDTTPLPPQERTIKGMEEWLLAFRNQWTISAACLKTGIERKTYYRWIEKYPDFKEKMEAIQVEQNEFIESKLYKAINEDNVGAVMFYLGRCNPKYRDKLNLNTEEEVRKAIALEKTSESIEKIADILKHGSNRNTNNKKSGGDPAVQEQQGEAVQTD